MTERITPASVQPELITLTSATKADTAAFLSHLHRGGMAGYYWTVTKSGAKRSHWWNGTGRDDPPRTTANLYFGVNPTTEIPTKNAKGETVEPKYARSRIGLIAALNCLFAEFDAKDYGGDLDATFKVVEALQPRPSAVIASGGGYHCYWPFDEPWIMKSDEERAQAKQLLYAWVDYTGGDPQSKDLARVLRLPGSLNYKYDPPRPVEFVWCEMERLYRRSDLAELVKNVWAQGKLGIAVEKVKNAPDGQKHSELLKASKFAGGVAHILGEQTIERELYDAIEPRADDPTNAARTIQDGIRYGKAAPLRFETGPHTSTNNGEEPQAALCSDLGNARRLVAQHGHDLRYVHEWGWLSWNGRCWALDTTGEIERRAKATAIGIYQEAADAPEHLKPSLARHAIASQSSGKLTSMIALATSEKEVRAQPQDFDSQDWLLTCANGTLDLRTGALRPHRQADMLTKAIDTAYDPDATAPRFLAFLDRIFAGNAEMIGYVQRVIGYCLTGSTGAQAMFIAHGTGANGKSVLLEVIRAMLGGYARNADPSTFLAQTSDRIRSDLARLAGVRFVSTIEIDEGRRMSEALVKQVTGGDPITACFKYQNEFEFMPRFKLLMATNHKPIIRGTDYAIWRRIRLIPFTVTIPEAERDPQLADKLKTELAGILAWGVRGCLDWQQHGLKEPQEVQAATNAYRAEMDVIGLFLDECCIQDRRIQVATADLYAAYAKWADDGGERPVTQRRFAQQMTERGFDRVHMRTGWVYIGIGLLDTRHEPPDGGGANSRECDPCDPCDLNSGTYTREKINLEDPPKLDHKDHKDHTSTVDLNYARRMVALGNDEALKALRVHCTLKRADYDEVLAMVQQEAGDAHAI